MLPSQPGVSGTTSEFSSSSLSARASSTAQLLAPAKPALPFITAMRNGMP